MLGAALVAAGLSACDGGDTTSAGTASTAPPMTAVPATAAPSPASTATTPATPPPTEVEPAIDAAALLTAAFDEVAGGYHFVTTATVAGAEILAAEGDRVGDSTRVTVSSNGQTVDYIVAPTGAWASIDAGWQELDQPPITDPIAPLRSPQSIAVESNDGGVVTLVATYPPTALSLTGEEPITVLFTIEGTTLHSIGYAADTAQGPASVSATVTALADPTPVSLPST